MSVVIDRRSEVDSELGRPCERVSGHPHQHVHPVVDERLKPLTRRHGHVAHRRGVSEGGCRDGATHVDVESEGFAVGGQQREPGHGTLNATAHKSCLEHPAQHGAVTSSTEPIHFLVSFVECLLCGLELRLHARKQRLLLCRPAGNVFGVASFRSEVRLQRHERRPGPGGVVERGLVFLVAHSVRAGRDDHHHQRPCGHRSSAVHVFPPVFPAEAPSDPDRSVERVLRVGVRRRRVLCEIPGRVGACDVLADVVAAGVQREQETDVVALRQVLDELVSR